VAETEATDSAGVLLGRQLYRLFLLAGMRLAEAILFLLFLLQLRLVGRWPLAKAASTWRCLKAINSVSMPASASTWWRLSSRPEARCGGFLAQHPLEPEHQRVADFPLGRGRRVPLLDLRDRVVEGAPAGRARGHDLDWILALAQERLARPGLGAACFGDDFFAGLIERCRKLVCRL